MCTHMFGYYEIGVAAYAFIHLTWTVVNSTFSVSPIHVLLGQYIVLAESI